MTDFSTLYKKYAPDVCRFALYLSGDRGRAEDITSETSVRAWTSPESIEVATVKAYLLDGNAPIFPAYNGREPANAASVNRRLFERKDARMPKD